MVRSNRLPYKTGYYTVYLIFEKKNRNDIFSNSFYIGYTSYIVNKRIQDHMSESKCSNKHTKKINWLKNLSIEDIDYLILHTNIETEKEALELEVKEIAKFKDMGCELVMKNGDSGGFGGTKNYSEDVIEKIRLSKIGNSWNKGKKLSKERREEISKRTKGIPKSQESIEKRKQSLILNKKLGLTKPFKKNILNLEEKDFKLIKELYDNGNSIYQIKLITNICRNTITKCLFDITYLTDFIPNRKDYICTKEKRPAFKNREKYLIKHIEILKNSIKRKEIDLNIFITGRISKLEEKVAFYKSVHELYSQGFVLCEIADILNNSAHNVQRAFHNYSIYNNVKDYINNGNIEHENSVLIKRKSIQNIKEILCKEIEELQNIRNYE